MNKATIDLIIKCSDAYYEENLRRWEPSSRLLSDWWVALDFFLSRACYQGRRDELSTLVYESIQSVLAPRFSGHERLDAQSGPVSKD